MRLICKGKAVILTMVMIFCWGVFGSQAAVDPVVVELHYQNGVKFYNRGLYEKAVQEFEKTLSLDPGQKEAKDYLEKAKSALGTNKVTDAQESKDAQIRDLYAQGRSRYEKHDYEGALEVFNKILELKHVDDFASFYREKCEIIISRKLAREKKAQEQKRFKEKRAQELAAKKNEKEMKKIERQTMLEKRAQINEERRRLQKEKALKKQEKKTEEKPPAAEEAKPEAGLEASKETTENMAAGPPELKPAEEKVLSSQEAIAEAPKEEPPVKALSPRQLKVEEKKKAREEKQAQIKEAREKKLAEQQEKAQAKEKARLDKIEDAKARKEQKQKEKEVRAEERKEARVKKNRDKLLNLEERKRAVQEKAAVKDLFVKGVEQYGRKDYDAAIVSFNAVVDAESQGHKLYTGSAQRMKEKAKRKLELLEKKSQ